MSENSATKTDLDYAIAIYDEKYFWALLIVGLIAILLGRYGA